MKKQLNTSLREKAIKALDQLTNFKYDNSRTHDKQVFSRLFRALDLRPLKSNNKMKRAIRLMIKSGDISRANLINCSMDSYGKDEKPDNLLFIRRPKIETNEHKLVICNLPSKKFYSSREWKALRYQALVKFGNRCICCGSSQKNGVIIHVDHIKPRSIYPERALDINNLQILCEPCNIGKSNIDETNWSKR